MISISPGHYGPKTGAQGLIDEGTENIRVAKRVTEILRASGIITNYIEDNNSKSAKGNIPWLIGQHNKTSREIDVSIHFNASPGTHSRGIGTETLVYTDKNKTVAQKITDSIANTSGLKNRGVKVRTDLGLLKGTNKPCYLIEVCFVNDSVDVAIYRRDFDKICRGIAIELAKAVGKSLSPSTTLFRDDGKVSANVINARNNIRKAVVSGVFTSAHADVNNYSTDELLKYLNVYIDRVTK